MEKNHSEVIQDYRSNRALIEDSLFAIRRLIRGFGFVPSIKNWRFYLFDIGAVLALFVTGFAHFLGEFLLCVPTLLD